VRYSLYVSTPAAVKQGLCLLVCLLVLFSFASKARLSQQRTKRPTGLKVEVRWSFAGAKKGSKARVKREVRESDDDRPKTEIQ
jgi:hypothetical protein